jgi:hypothetical protein
VDIDSFPGSSDFLRLLTHRPQVRVEFMCRSVFDIYTFPNSKIHLQGLHQFCNNVDNKNWFTAFKHWKRLLSCARQDIQNQKTKKSECCVNHQTKSQYNSGLAIVRKSFLFELSILS